MFALFALLAIVSAKDFLINPGTQTSTVVELGLCQNRGTTYSTKQVKVHDNTMQSCTYYKPNCQGTEQCSEIIKLDEELGQYISSELPEFVFMSRSYQSGDCLEGTEDALFNIYNEGCHKKE